mmetsp:Transcript_24120/g.58288  ORF Transcript_24120/g.58288 Transcript_24120/m.58288 type:complete len:273 (+) Transcript_24120:1817-2635(+)
MALISSSPSSRLQSGSMHLICSTFPSRMFTPRYPFQQALWNMCPHSARGSALWISGRAGDPTILISGRMSSKQILQVSRPKSSSSAHFLMLDLSFCAWPFFIPALLKMLSGFGMWHRMYILATPAFSSGSTYISIDIPASFSRRLSEVAFFSTSSGTEGPLSRFWFCSSMISLDFCLFISSDDGMDVATGSSSAGARCCIAISSSAISCIDCPWVFSIAFWMSANSNPISRKRLIVDEVCLVSIGGSTNAGWEFCRRNLRRNPDMVVESVAA